MFASKLAILLLLGATPLSAQWKTALTVTTHVALVADGLTTAVCLETVPSCQEHNILLGSRPTIARLAVYNGLWHLAVQYAPRKVRPYVQLGVLAVSLVMLSTNPCALRPCR